MVKKKETPAEAHDRISKATLEEELAQPDTKKVFRDLTERGAAEHEGVIGKMIPKKKRRH